MAMEMDRALVQLLCCYLAPSEGLRQEILAFKQSFYDAGETMIHGSGGLDYFDTFEEWLQYLEDIRAGRTEGLVPSQVYVVKQAGSSRIDGILDMRPALPKEKEEYGHIGYAVAPGARKKGIATAMLWQATCSLHSAGIEKVLVAIHEENAPSRALAEKMGFVCIYSYLYEKDNKTVLMYQHTNEEE